MVNVGARVIEQFGFGVDGEHDKTGIEAKKKRPVNIGMMPVVVEEMDEMGVGFETGEDAVDKKEAVEAEIEGIEGGVGEKLEPREFA